MTACFQHALHSAEHIMTDVKCRNIAVHEYVVELCIKSSVAAAITPINCAVRNELGDQCTARDSAQEQAT